LRGSKPACATAGWGNITMTQGTRRNDSGSQIQKVAAQQLVFIFLKYHIVFLKKR